MTGGRASPGFLCAAAKTDPFCRFRGITLVKAPPKLPEM